MPITSFFLSSDHYVGGTVVPINIRSLCLRDLHGN